MSKAPAPSNVYYIPFGKVFGFFAGAYLLQQQIFFIKSRYENTRPPREFDKTKEVARKSCTILKGYDVVVREHLRYRRAEKDRVDKFGSMSIEPSVESEVSSWKKLVDSATEQSLVKCLPETSPDSKCKADPKVMEVPYLKVMLSALALLPSPLSPDLSICQIGVGGAALPMFLQHYFGPWIRHLDLVDVEPSVFYLAAEELGLRSLLQRDKLAFHPLDGEAFLIQSGVLYDAVFVDTFVGSDVPAHMISIDFLELLKKSLSYSGVAAFNLPSRDPNFIARCKKIFGYNHVFDISVTGSTNNIVVAANYLPESFSARNFFMRSHYFSKDANLPFSLSTQLPLMWLFT